MDEVVLFFLHLAAAQNSSWTSRFWIPSGALFINWDAPLVLVDGIERSLSNISPEEIESFSVLKDATAFSSLWC